MSESPQAKTHPMSSYKDVCAVLLLRRYVSKNVPWNRGPFYFYPLLPAAALALSRKCILMVGHSPLGNSRPAFGICWQVKAAPSLDE